MKVPAVKPALLTVNVISVSSEVPEAGEMDNQEDEFTSAAVQLMVPSPVEERKIFFHILQLEPVNHLLGY